MQRAIDAKAAASQAEIYDARFVPALVLTAEKPGRMAGDRLTARENEDA